MGRTVPSFRIVLAEEKQEWKPFRNALDKPERKEFDEMWDIPRLYVSACSNSVQLVPFHSIAMSILFHHYKELLECEKQIIKLTDNNINGERIISNSMMTIITIDNVNEDLQDDVETEEHNPMEQHQLRKFPEYLE